MIKKQLEYPFDYSFHTINPDWGIIVQVCDILKDKKIKTNLEHIKGHQDDDMSYEKLDLPAGLNTDVDFMAVDYRTTQGNLREKAIQLPSHRVQLHVSGCTITSQYYK
eukprot:4272162-Ditylum_brightwellii.AAC.1